MNQDLSLSGRLAGWPSLKIRPTLAYEGEPPPVHRHAHAVNGFYSFWLVQSGGVLLQGKFGKIRLKQAEWIFFPPFLSKRQDFDEGTRILSVGFEATWSDGIPWMEFNSPLTGRKQGRNGLITKARRILTAFSSGSRQVPVQDRRIDLAGIACLQSRLYSFLESLTPLVLKNGGRLMLSEAHNPRIYPLISELRMKPGIHPLPFGRWREMVGLSRVQIDRLFRAELGYTPKELGNRFLLASLKRELVTGRSSLKELAARFGFSDSSHLCRWFRRRASMSPEQFRRYGVE